MFLFRATQNSAPANARTLKQWRKSWSEPRKLSHGRLILGLSLFLVVFVDVFLYRKIIFVGAVGDVLDNDQGLREEFLRGVDRDQRPKSSASINSNNYHKCCQESSISKNRNNDSGCFNTNNKTCNDYVDSSWEKYHKNLQQGEDASEELLKLYGCPLFSTQFGILQEESNNSNNYGKASWEPPYSRVPTDDTTWKLFEEAYRFALGTVAPPQPAGKELLKTNDEKPLFFPASRGLMIPFEVRYDRTVGRSVHTTAFVPKGTKIWKSSSTVAFLQDDGPPIGERGDVSTPTPTKTGFVDDSDFVKGGPPAFSTYRLFLDYLQNHRQSHNALENSNDYDWACDALMWTYGGNSKTRAAQCIDFGHGSLFNNARGNTKDANLDGNFCDDVPFEGRRIDATPIDPPVVAATNTTEGSFPANPEGVNCLCFWMFATRDIQPGEELRYEYNLEGNPTNQPIFD